MSGRYLLGLDGGSSSTKAVIFDMEGEVIGIGRSASPTDFPQPNWVERDMAQAWQGTAHAIREALENARVSGPDIAAIGVTAHGDGLYVADAKGEPLGPGITSMDERARSVVARWQDMNLTQAALDEVGQMPVPYAPVTLLAWMKDNQPERYARIGHVLSCKDWLRFKLTGKIAADFTESSTGFTNVNTQTYSDNALALFGISEVEKALPEVLMPDQIAGYVSAEAARETHLLEGTPVATGLHDVTASAVGLGNAEAGKMTITTGTFSINEVFSDKPRPDLRWATRNGIRPGQWLNMAISPASSSNLEWFYRQWRHGDEGSATAFLADMDDELEEAFASPSQLIYHPFLYGSPYKEPASGALLGLRGWHGRGHVLRAILEGVVFNHRIHVDGLGSAFNFNRASITGGGSYSPRLAQLFADSLNLTIETSCIREAAAWGAAMCAGVAVGAFDALESAVGEGGNHVAYSPIPANIERCQKSFEHYNELIERLKPSWPTLYGESPDEVSAAPAKQKEAAR